MLTSLADARKRLPRDVDYPIERDRELRRHRIEPVAAELLLAAVERASAAGLVAKQELADAKARILRPLRLPVACAICGMHSVETLIVRDYLE